MTSPRFKTPPRSWIADIAARPPTKPRPVLRTHRWHATDGGAVCAICDCEVSDDMVRADVGVQVVTDVARDILLHRYVLAFPNTDWAKRTEKCPRT